MRFLIRVTQLSGMISSRHASAVRPEAPCLGAATGPCRWQPLLYLRRNSSLPPRPTGRAFSHDPAILPQGLAPRVMAACILSASCGNFQKSGHWRLPIQPLVCLRQSGPRDFPSGARPILTYGARMRLPSRQFDASFTNGAYTISSGLGVPGPKRHAM